MGEIRCFTVERPGIAAISIENLKKLQRMSDAAAGRRADREEEKGTRTFPEAGEPIPTQEEGREAVPGKGDANLS